MKALTNKTKYQYKLLEDQKMLLIAIKKMKIQEKKGKTTESILVKSYGNNIDLHPVIT